jgi:uncharacterized repeat protein (TIGR03803 family)
MRTLFRITTAGNLTTLLSFDGTNGVTPYGLPLVQATNGELYGTTAGGGPTVNMVICMVYYGCGTLFQVTTSGALTTLHDFCSQSGCADGATPLTGLVQATNGDLYGAATAGGTYGYGGKGDGYGTIFKITPSGELTAIYEFQGEGDGSSPTGGLLQDANGEIYGIGFSVTLSGSHEKVYGSEGASEIPETIIQGPDGGLYEASEFGGG